MILAAGRGSRLRPLTDLLPKPLIQIAGKPIIVHLIERLAEAGITKLVINLGYRGDQIRTYLGSGKQLGVRIQYSKEFPRPLETGGGVFQALPMLDNPFIIVNGDIATDFDFRALPKKINSFAHLVVTKNPPHNPSGDFTILNHQLLPLPKSPYTYTGIGVFSHELFINCKAGYFPLAPLLHKAAYQNKLSGQLFTGFWSDIGTLNRLESCKLKYQCI